ncbi:MAG: 30S ribosomal protein S2 [Deltaproteobacteria bacterium]|nr:30S ribosomal protein S2 [Deltaproteobacteria bacterium]
MSTDVSVKDLLGAGAHFGHQTQRWNPKMKEYIFGARNGIYIIDLSTTYKLLGEACEFIQKCTAQGGKILFVGTKVQAQEVTREEALRCGMPFVTHRWLGGTLTNFNTIKIGINRLKEIEHMKETGVYEQLPKKETAQLEKERGKLQKVFEGIRDMQDLPEAIFIVDPRREAIAVREANKLGITVVAVVDTNTDPDGVDYVIPGNDDAVKAIKLYTSAMADSVLKGKVVFEEKLRAQEKSGSKKDKDKKGEGYSIKETDSTTPGVKVEKVHRLVKPVEVLAEELMDDSEVLPEDFDATQNGEEE